MMLVMIVKKIRNKLLNSYTESISEIFASARIPCTWQYNIHNQEDIIFNSVKH